MLGRIVGKSNLLNKSYQLRFKINKHNYEIIGNYGTPSLAYGIRKKLCNEEPQRYNAKKLYVAII